MTEVSKDLFLPTNIYLLNHMGTCYSFMLKYGWHSEIGWKLGFKGTLRNLVKWHSRAWNVSRGRSTESGIWKQLLRASIKGDECFLFPCKSPRGFNFNVWCWACTPILLPLVFILSLSLRQSLSSPEPDSLGQDTR